MKVELTRHQANNLRRMLEQAMDTYPTRGGSTSGTLSSSGVSVAWAFAVEADQPLGDWREHRKKSVTEKCITLEISKNGGKE